jgi:signal transduction histidine kinase
MRSFHPRHWSLALKFPLTIIAVVAGVGFTIGVIVIVHDTERSIAASTPESILHNDYWLLYKTVRSAFPEETAGTAYDRVISAMILDADGRILAHSDPSAHPIGLAMAPNDVTVARSIEQALRLDAPRVLSPPESADFVDAAVPLFSDDKRLGLVLLRVSTAAVAEHTADTAYAVLAATLILVILASALGIGISLSLMRPLRRLSDEMRRLSKSPNLNAAPIPVSSDDELGKLTTAFNDMVAELAGKRALEEEIAISNKLTALGRVAAGVAHEINNPLAGMLSCIDTLKKHREQEGLVDRYLPLLQSGLERISRIVQSLLVEVRATHEFDPCGPECLDELRPLLDAEVGSRPLNIVWENRLSPPTLINRTPTQQILYNLLKNAVEAMPDGGTVSFRAFDGDDGILIEVNDDGPGIPEEERKHLFDPFYTTKPNGTGLGLWIVYNTVERLRGAIRVESQIGEGTLFQVFLPVTVGDGARWSN